MCRAGVSPARRAHQREQPIGFADGAGETPALLCCSRRSAVGANFCRRTTHAIESPSWKWNWRGLTSAAASCANLTQDGVKATHPGSSPERFEAEIAMAWAMLISVWHEFQPGQSQDRCFHTGGIALRHRHHLHSGRFDPGGGEPGPKPGPAHRVHQPPAVAGRRLSAFHA